LGLPYSNPHSQGFLKLFDKLEDGVKIGPLSSAVSQKVEESRELVLEWLGLEGVEYDVIFTNNSTQGCQIIGEMISESRQEMREKEEMREEDDDEMFLYAFNSHTSVIGEI